MFDSLEYDKITYPNTGYVANLLVGTPSGLRWSFDFFGKARQDIQAGRANDRDCYLKFKELISKSLPQQGLLRVSIDKIDWPALFNFVEETTRPSKTGTGLPSITLRAPSDV